MRRQIGATALAVVALLTVSAFTSGAAHAADGANVSADDIFYPEGQEPKAAADASQPAAASSDDRDSALARGDRQAADLLGFLPSLYQGKWFVPANEDERRCIMLRESHANYRASSGTYHGAYQMSSALAVGATWMMQKEVRREMGDEGVAIVEALRKTTPNNWNRYWQDRAFWTIWQAGSGAGHWNGGSHNC
ncbi:MAG: hypothetical protein NTX29_08575 [Actinobacteria bacterium]|nr:hypothetical protein [Actinomycetota bacterium]